MIGVRVSRTGYRAIDFFYQHILRNVYSHCTLSAFDRGKIFQTVCRGKAPYTLRLEAICFPGDETHRVRLKCYKIIDMLIYIFE